MDAHKKPWMWALEAYKKPLKWPFRGLEGLEGFRPGKRQAWTPIKSHGCGLLPAMERRRSHGSGLVGAWMWAFACDGSPEEAIEVAF